MASMKISSAHCYIASRTGCSPSSSLSHHSCALKGVPSTAPRPSRARCQSLLCHGASCRNYVVHARLGRTGGAGVLERPGLDQSQSGQEPRVEEGGEMGKVSQRRIFGGGDRYRVLLLDHEKHTEGQVVSVLPKVVPSITADEARKCFRTSREMGVGIVTVTVKEHAEFYAQMMARCGLRSGIEPDCDTI